MKETFSPSVWAVAVFWVCFNYTYYIAPVFAMFLLFCFGFALKRFSRNIVLSVQWGGILGVSFGYALLLYPMLEYLIHEFHLWLFLAGAFSFTGFFAGGLFRFGLKVGKDFESSEESGSGA